MAEKNISLQYFLTFLIFCNCYFNLSWACTPLVDTDGIGKGIEGGAKQLNEAIQKASGDLSNSINRGVDAAAEAVNTMSDTVIDLAKSVNLKIDSGDLDKIGGVASRNLAEGLVNLTRNWELALNTSHLQSVGADAAKHLSQALQNIRIYTFEEAVCTGVVPMSLYISIAGGFAFAVLFIAIVVSMKSCRKCLASSFGLCAKKNGNNNDNNQRIDDQEDAEPNLWPKKGNQYEKVPYISKKSTTESYIDNEEWREDEHMYYNIKDNNKIAEKSGYA